MRNSYCSASSVSLRRRSSESVTSSWIVQVGHVEQQPGQGLPRRAHPPERVGQVVGDHAVFIHAHFDEGGPVVPDDVKGRGIGRTTHDHSIARGHEGAQRQVQHLLRSVHDENVVAHRPDPVLTDISDDLVAQLREPVQRPILECLGAEFACRVRGFGADVRQRVRKRVAATERNQVGRQPSRQGLACDDASSGRNLFAHLVACLGRVDSPGRLVARSPRGAFRRACSCPKSRTKDSFYFVMTKSRIQPTI